MTMINDDMSTKAPGLSISIDNPTFHESTDGRANSTVRTGDIKTSMKELIRG